MFFQTKAPGALLLETELDVKRHFGGDLLPPDFPSLPRRRRADDPHCFLVEQRIGSLKDSDITKLPVNSDHKTNKDPALNAIPQFLSMR